MGQSLREENPPYEKFLYSDRKDLCRSLSLMTPVSRTGGLWEIQMPSTPLQPVTLGGLSPARIRMLATLQVLLDDGSLGGGAGFVSQCYYYLPALFHRNNFLFMGP